MSTIFSNSDFTAAQLTTRANDAVKTPFVETLARRLFRERSIAGPTVQIDRESFGTTRLPKVARGTTAGAQVSTRSRDTYAKNGIKIGDKLVITPAQMDGVRMTGLQSGDAIALESLNSLVDQGLAEKFANMDYTVEEMCIQALQGIVMDPTDGVTPEADYPSLFGVAQPGYVDLLLREANPEMGALRGRFRTALKNIRNGLGGLIPTGHVAFYGSDAWEDFQDHPELRDAFQRKDDGSFLSSNSFDSVRFAGIEHVEYRGPGIAADEVIIAPMGIPGMFDLDFCSGDKLGFTNEPGEPRYVIPKNQNDPFQDFGEGAEWELSSVPLPVNLRPEAVQRCYGDNTTPAE
ncbi:hypothetical protein RA2_04073 [Roseovarius sp. A-2]|uniref:major capsid protein n=1 Tax=Roseovarius sp. A-2 TaxID=1570360 RepID=UPI0009B58348|nr:major capsid protein [Roseovarius sp. A-2]GAW36998.1 hypothetical protein RA2_04073 [Roseovarius sp. A-2]